MLARGYFFPAVSTSFTGCRSNLTSRASSQKKPAVTASSANAIPSGQRRAMAEKAERRRMRGTMSADYERARGFRKAPLKPGRE